LLPTKSISCRRSTDRRRLRRSAEFQMRFSKQRPSSRACVRMCHGSTTLCCGVNSERYPEPLRCRWGCLLSSHTRPGGNPSGMPIFRAFNNTTTWSRVWFVQNAALPITSWVQGSYATSDRDGMPSGHCTYLHEGAPKSLDSTTVMGCNSECCHRETSSLGSRSQERKERGCATLTMLKVNSSRDIPSSM